MRILVSNDDGVYAKGLAVLAKYLKKVGDVTVVAPLEERSTMGHALTLHKPLRIHKTDSGFYGVNGSPADCVYIGMREILKGTPDIVISGPNRGANLGQDVYYSGTVSAAREACILGIPSIAISVDLSVSLKKNKKKVLASEEVHYETAALEVVAFIRWLKKKKMGYPKNTFYNLNVPNLPHSKLKGVQVTRLGFRYYSGTIMKRVDHRGRPYFWVGGQYKGFEDEPGTDCHAVARYHTSVTPVQLDCSNHATIEELMMRQGS